MLACATSRATRTVLALATAASVGMTGLASAAQADMNDHGKKKKKVEVTICKKVKDNYGHDYGQGGRDKDEEEFDIYAETDRAEAYFDPFEDGDCQTEYLRYRDGEVHIYEDREDSEDYKVTYRVHKGHDYKVKHGVLTVYFDEYNDYKKRRPKVRVTVINKEKYEHDHYRSQV